MHRHQLSTQRASTRPSRHVGVSSAEGSSSFELLTPSAPRKLQRGEWSLRNTCIALNVWKRPYLATIGATGKLSGLLWPTSFLENSGYSWRPIRGAAYVPDSNQSTKGPLALARPMMPAKPPSQAQLQWPCIRHEGQTAIVATLSINNLFHAYFHAVPWHSFLFHAAPSSVVAQADIWTRWLQYPPLPSHGPCSLRWLEGLHCSVSHNTCIACVQMHYLYAPPT